MKYRNYIVAASLMLIPLIASGQQKGPIELTSKSEKESIQTNQKGEKEVKRVDATKAKVIPGDVVVFTTNYVNTGKTPAAHVVITNPVPEHMLYIDKTAEGKGSKIEFSVDGAKTYAAPDKLRITDAQGKVRPALAGDYTHIKWTLSLPLAPGGQGSVSFKAHLK